MDQLALGAAIAILVRGPLQKVVMRWAPFVLAFTSATVVSMCLMRHTVDRAEPLIWTVGYSLIALAYGSLLLMCLRSGWTQALFSWFVLRTFGKYSYGLYLYHFPLAAILSPMKERLVAWTHSLLIGGSLYIALCLLVNLLVAAASFRFFESPIIGLKRRFSYAAEARS
jgi:peptidoglycan/LPS O-acetylase OafA/YrhL